MSTDRSCETGSLFLVRKPPTLYVTSPAKWRTAKDVALVLISTKLGCLLCVRHAFCR